MYFSPSFFDKDGIVFNLFFNNHNGDLGRGIICGKVYDKDMRFQPEGL